MHYDLYFHLNTRVMLAVLCSIKTHWKGGLSVFSSDSGHLN